MDGDDVVHYDDGKKSNLSDVVEEIKQHERAIRELAGELLRNPNIFKTIRHNGQSRSANTPSACYVKRSA